MEMESEPVPRPVYTQTRLANVLLRPATLTTTATATTRTTATVANTATTGTAGSRTLKRKAVDDLNSGRNLKDSHLPPPPAPLEHIVVNPTKPLVVDRFRTPWDHRFQPHARTVLPDSKSSTTGNKNATTTHQDFEYKIHEDECRFCQEDQAKGAAPCVPSVNDNYHVVLSLSPTMLVTHKCEQRALERTPIGMILTWITCREHPRGIIRTYSPFADMLAGTDIGHRVRTMRELGHLLDHSAGIWTRDEIWTFGMLRHTPMLVTDLDQLDLSREWRTPWPARQDTLVPKEYREWWAAYLEGARGEPEVVVSTDAKKANNNARPRGWSSHATQIATASVTAIAKGLTRPNINTSRRETVSPAPTTTTTTTTTTRSTTTTTKPILQSKKNPPAVTPIRRTPLPGNVLASVNPYTQGMPVMPPFDDACKDWEGVTDAPDALWNWTYDPSVHTLDHARGVRAPVVTTVVKTKPVPLDIVARRRAMRMEAARAEQTNKFDAQTGLFPLSGTHFALQLNELPKPPQLYYSEDRMRDWRAKTLSIGHELQYKIHRRFSLAVMLEHNETQKLWSDPKSHVAREWNPRQSAPPSASKQTVSGGAAPPARIPDHETIATHGQYVSWWRGKEWQRSHKALETELRMTVDLIWCLYFGDMRLRYPEKTMKVGEKPTLKSLPVFTWLKRVGK